ncbi:MAG: 3'-5' exonuclease [Bacteroidia bacterium]|uniref:DNA polymerase III PolC-type n=1 Tax=bioreactor metagenome TaxID=1076179 RepID=A0A644X2G5_9ZZZZ|nr:3'-5' exonuclease [Rikenellaceae bacterium]NCB18825.1 3'-5' exonuclease [Bacteroidia bacterium]
MKINLKNPLLFFDIESTGLNVASDRIVEISALKLMPNGDQEIKTRRLNPTIPISPEAQKIHGISNEDVADCPTFKEVAKSLANWMSGCDFAGYNAIKFDIPLLAEEMLRAGVQFDFRKRKVVDVQNIFHKMEQRTLSAAYKFYCSKELENAHSAEADTVATFEILEAQLDRYSDVLENDVKFLAEFSTKSKLLDYAGRIALDNNDEPIINFGKYKGKKVTEVLTRDPGYYAWIMNGDFTLDTKQVLTELKIQMENNSRK